MSSHIRARSRHTPFVVASRWVAQGRCTGSLSPAHVVSVTHPHYNRFLTQWLQRRTRGGRCCPFIMVLEWGQPGLIRSAHPTCRWKLAPMSDVRRRSSLSPTETRILGPTP